MCTQLTDSTLEPLQRVFLRCCSFRRRSSTTRPRHSSSDGTTLAACASTYHIAYKLCTLMHAVVYGHGPQYLMDRWGLCHNLQAGLISMFSPERRIWYAAHSHNIRIEIVCRRSSSGMEYTCHRLKFDNSPLPSSPSTERGGTARHWCSPTWSHDSGSETSPLVAYETENRSNWRRLFTSRCMVVLHRTCRTTVNTSRTWDVDISGLPASTHVSCRGHSHRLATGVSL